MVNHNSFIPKIEPETVNDDGDIVPAQELLIPIQSSRANRDDLFEKHGDIAAHPDSDFDAARASGSEIAKRWLADPDSFGADWPTAGMNKRAHEAAEARTVAIPPEVKAQVEAIPGKRRDPHRDANVARRALDGYLADQNLRGK